ncbi:hypothetical protein Pmani_023141 [Petrolisthes manimaculis]|nr:hypothetical protein Pmani_023141 [Petrolisthes manimaculis]
MGKSSSSSAAEHLLSSGGEDTRWTSVEPDLPLGSAEDELWQLLDVIQRKGTRLRHDLDRAERIERERLVHPSSGAPLSTPSPASDPLVQHHHHHMPLHHHQQHHQHQHMQQQQQPPPHLEYRDAWPHSLPGPTLGHSYPSRTHQLLLPPPPPPPPPMGVALEAEAWAAVERLRQDRQYLAGRVSWAEAEAAASHQRLLDLHTQLVALAGDKRRLEDQVRALCLHTTTTNTQHTLDHNNTHTSDERTHSHTHPKDVHLQFVKSNGVRDGAGGIVHSVMGGVNTVHIATDHTTHTTHTLATGKPPRRPAPTVTVSVGGGGGFGVCDGGVLEDPHRGNTNRPTRSSSSVRLNTDRGEVILPRVLKVPIKDRTPRTKDRDHENNTNNNKNNNNKEEEDAGRVGGTRSSNNKGGEQGTGVGGGTRGSDRVVIERERRPGRADGGWSMPVSLLKGGAKVKVPPNKQRISAILREKDVIELQRQLLTTVMEAEVLRKQVETAGEKWESKAGEWEAQHRASLATITALRDQNQALKTKVDVGEEVCVSVKPVMSEVSTMTDHLEGRSEHDDDEDEEEASHRVHQGPNVKYDVVIHQDPPPRRQSTTTTTQQQHTTASSSQHQHTHTRRESGQNSSPQQSTPPRPDHPPPPRKAGLAGVEKPPRRTREVRSAPSPGTHSSHRGSPTGDNHGGRDSLGRGGNGTRLRPSLSHTGRGTTPTAVQPKQQQQHRPKQTQQQPPGEQQQQQQQQQEQQEQVSDRTRVPRHGAANKAVTTAGGGVQ